jgi:hypothetical protein
MRLNGFKFLKFQQAAARDRLPLAVAFRSFYGVFIVKVNKKFSDCKLYEE